MMSCLLRHHYSNRLDLGQSLLTNVWYAGMILEEFNYILI